MPRFQYKSDTEISLGRIFSLGEDAQAKKVMQATPAQGEAVRVPSRVLTMKTMGQLGRFGNQVLQYAYLSCLAKSNNAELQVPDWIGKHIYGLADEEPSRCFPPLVESTDSKSNSSFGPMYLDHALHDNQCGNGRTISMADVASPDDSCVNKDVVGWFQGHFSHLSPFKQHIQDTFTLVPEIRTVVDKFVSEVRSRGRTLVVLHLRLGDYKNIPLTSFGFLAPVEWYVAWLRAVLPLLDDPVVYVASDDLPAVMEALKEFNPLCERDLCPEGSPQVLKDYNAGFLIDHTMIQHADLAAISNSTFSFTACLLNKNKDARFYRPHWEQGLVPFDPWNDYPVLHRPGKVVGTLPSALAVVLKTQGVVGLVSNMLWEVPTFYARIAVMNTVLSFRRYFRSK